MSDRNSLLSPFTSLGKAVLFALVFISLSAMNAFAATDWSAIQTALQANGNVLPGDVLRLELDRQDLSITVNGQALASNVAAAVANGYIAFKEVRSGVFFADGSLPAQESEVAALETALRANPRIHITAIGSRLLFESPKLIWVHFEARGNGVELAASLFSALAAIHSPQLNVTAVPGLNDVLDPSSILPPNFLKLFDEGYVEQFGLSFAFYLPRPDESRLYLGDVKAETGLGVGSSFYINVPFSGGTNVTLNIDFALRRDEVQVVEDTLRAGGFTVESQTEWFSDDDPHLTYVHATASGDGFSLGDTLYSVVEIIQSDSGPSH